MALTIKAAGKAGKLFVYTNTDACIYKQLDQAARLCCYRRQKTGGGSGAKAGKSG
jgi:hypothetical protein